MKRGRQRQSLRQPPPDPAAQLLHEENESLRDRIDELHRRIVKAYEISKSFSISDTQEYLLSLVKGIPRDTERT